MMIRQAEVNIGVRKAAKQIIVSAMALAVLCLVCRFAFCRGYTLYVPWQTRAEDMTAANGITAVPEHPEILRADAPEPFADSLRIRLHAGRPGDTDLYVYDSHGAMISMHVMHVGPAGTVYDGNTGGFTGDAVLMITLGVFWLLVSAIMLWHYMIADGPDFYAYSTIYYAGFSLFALVTGAVMLTLTLCHIALPFRYTMIDVLDSIRGAGIRFMQLTTPLMILFAAVMAIANMVLLLHERASLRNLIGIGISVLLAAGEALGWYMFTRDFSGAEWEGRLFDTLQNTYATVFIYFECMLMGAVISGIRAARHEPESACDYIIVLGCWFRRDGTLPPLLRDRTDRALAYWRRQQSETGHEAVLITSGGQGPDEPMPEAQAMRAYLLRQGVPDELILTEEHSRSTLENMVNSRKLLKNDGREPRVVFSTSSYHVFRSGLWARRAGLRAEGIGSRTAWWFWPNAFIRETVGLLLHRWRQELLLLVLLVVFFGAMTMLI